MVFQGLRQKGRKKYRKIISKSMHFKWNKIRRATVFSFLPNKR